MINFYELKLVKNKTDNFVGIRKSKSDDGFEFCLPYGFNDFPEGDFDQVRDLFFKMYRTFRKFERENKDTKRFHDQENKPEYQQEQDQITRSSGGISIQSEDGEPCVLYSKLRMIERVLEAYDDLAINSVQKKMRRSEKIDYSQIHKYLNRAIYLDDDVIYVETMDFPHPMVRYESTDIVNLYCYILDEIVQQLDSDVPDNILARSQDIRFLAQPFKDDYLTSNQSIFEKDTFVETINILKDALDKIDKNTYYKDADYWGLYEAIETFLYGELNADKNDGDFWGIKGFSLVWEDMCNTYFFKNHYNQIRFADTDIPLKGHENRNRQGEEKNRVGKLFKKYRDDDGNYKIKWIFSQLSNIAKRYNSAKKKGWNELLHIEFDLNNRTYDGYIVEHIDHQENLLLERYPCPDLVLETKTFDLEIIDYKDVPLEFYINTSLPPEYANKYRNDIIKQLTYELALQQTHIVSANKFFIPYYYELTPIPEPLGEIAFDKDLKDLKGIKVFKANFFLIQESYLENNL